MRLARRAGSHEATKAVAPRTRGAATKVTGSLVATPNSSPPRSRDTANAPTMPIVPPRGNQAQSAAQQQEHDGAGFGPQRHANSDLAGTLRLRVTDQSEQADR